MTKYKGDVRRYTVYVPNQETLRKKSPLVVDIHGYSSSSFQQEKMSGMKEVADKENFIVAWPSGSINQLGLRYFDAGFCCNLTPKKRDDVGFVRMIVENVKDKLLVNERKIYATGLSNGGGLTYQLYCKASDMFAAYAPLVFNFAKNDKCSPEILRPLHSFNSIQDTIVPHRGGLMPAYGTILSTYETNLKMADINQCRDEIKFRRLKGKSVCMEYQNCTVPFHHCNLDNPKRPDGGHILYFNNDKLDLATEIWNFFKKTTF